MHQMALPGAGLYGSLENYHHLADLKLPPIAAVLFRSVNSALLADVEVSF